MTNNTSIDTYCTGTNHVVFRSPRLWPNKIISFWSFDEKMQNLFAFLWEVKTCLYHSLGGQIFVYNICLKLSIAAHLFIKL